MTVSPDGFGDGGDDDDVGGGGGGECDVGSIQVPAPEQMLESLWDTESDDVFDEVRMACSSQRGWCGRICRVF